jgi:hypothetical protein
MTRYLKYTHPSEFRSTFRDTINSACGGRLAQKEKQEWLRWLMCCRMNPDYDLHQASLLNWMAWPQPDGSWQVKLATGQLRWLFTLQPADYFTIWHRPMTIEESAWISRYMGPPNSITPPRPIKHKLKAKSPGWKFVEADPLGS